MYLFQYQEFRQLEQRVAEGLQKAPTCLPPVAEYQGYRLPYHLPELYLLHQIKSNPAEWYRASTTAYLDHYLSTLRFSSVPYPDPDRPSSPTNESDVKPDNEPGPSGLKNQNSDQAEVKIKPIGFGRPRSKEKKPEVKATSMLSRLISKANRTSTSYTPLVNLMGTGSDSLLSYYTEPGNADGGPAVSRLFPLVQTQPTEGNSTENVPAERLRTPTPPVAVLTDAEANMCRLNISEENGTVATSQENGDDENNEKDDSTTGSGSECDCSNESKNEEIAIKIDEDAKLCPLRFVSPCHWLGTSEDSQDIIAHCLEVHPANFFMSHSEKLFVSKFDKLIPRKYFIIFCELGNMFRLTWDLDARTRMMRFGMYFLYDFDDGARYVFEVDFLNGRKKVVKIRGPCVFLADEEEMFHKTNYFTLHYDMIKKYCDSDGSLSFNVNIMKESGTQQKCSSSCILINRE